MAIEYRGEEILFVVELAGGTLARPFNQTGGSKDISADTIDLDTKDKTGSDYGKIAETVSLEGILTEGDPFIDDIKAAIRLKKLVKIYEVNTRTKKAEYGSYMISSFNREYSNGEFATYSLEATLNGVIVNVVLDAIPDGAKEPEPPTPPEPLKYKNSVVRTKWYQGVLGTLSGNPMTFRSRHAVVSDIEDFILEFGNYFNDDDPARLTNCAPFDLTVAVQIEGDTTFHDVTFGGGNLTQHFEPGDSIKSDPVEIPVTAGKYITVSMYFEGTKFPHAIVSQTANGEGARAGNQLKSQTFSPISQAVFGPVAIYGRTADRSFETIACIGDSISIGANFGTAIYGDYLQGELGFMQLTALTSGRGYVTLGMNGQQLTGFGPNNRPRRIAIAKYGSADIALVNYGTNDLAYSTSSLDELKAKYLDVWKACKDAGMRVYQTTITPRTTSTDSWATTEAQTPINAKFAGGDSSLRSQINDWIRTKPSADLDGIIDVASIVETGPNSGFWKAETTDDGIHPIRNAHIEMAEACVLAIGT